jgi:hypothetical protein
LLLLFSFIKIFRLPLLGESFFFPGSLPAGFSCAFLGSCRAQDL